MAILKQKLRSGHRDGIVFQPLPDGRQGVRSMPGHYRDSKHPRLLEYRGKQRSVLLAYRALRDGIWGCFETGKDNQDQYNRFFSRNMLMASGGISHEDYMLSKGIVEPYFVSDGTLRPLASRMDGDRLCFEMNAGEWKAGDIVRLVTLSQSAEGVLSAHYHDTVVSKPETKTYCSESLPHPAACAFVHIRDTRKGRKTSTQQLMVIGE